MNTKHTLGPWSTDGSNIKSRDGHNVAIVKGPWTVGASNSALKARAIEHARDEANARLIAAAPDLLAALEAALANEQEHGQDWQPWAQDARAAIEKAKG